MAEKAEYNKESILALARIPADAENVSALAGACQTWLDRLNDQKWVRATQHFENAAFLLGNHVTRFFWDGASFGHHTFGVHDQTSNDGVVVSVVDNRLLRPVESSVALLCSGRPSARVEPNSDLPEDEDAADLSALAVDMYFEKPIDMPRLRREAGYIAALCGTVAIETEYTDTDQPVEVPRYKRSTVDNPLFGLENEPEEVEVEVEDGTEIVYRKDIVARIWTPFHLVPDPAATGAHDLTWIARQTFEDIDWIKEKFDKKGDSRYFPENLANVRACSASRVPLYWWHRLQDIIEAPQYPGAVSSSMTSQSYGTEGGVLPNQTLLTIIDVKPSAEFPRGRTLILAGGNLVYADDARAWSEKYPWRWHPYSFFHWYKLPGKFWGTPLVTFLVPLQKRINAIDALVKANRQYMSIGQWKIPKHSKVAEGRISGIPGEHLIYTAVPGMSEPEKVDHRGLPQELLVERELCISAMDEIAASGLSGTEKISPSANRAGIMLDFIRQEKLRSKAPMLQEFEAMVESVAQNLLIELQLNLEGNDPELTARLQAAARGKAAGTMIESFTAASLRDHHSVHIDVVDEMMNTPEAKASRGLEYLQYVGDAAQPQEREAVFRLLKLDEFARNQENLSVKRARRMISRIVAGMTEAAVPMPGIDVPEVMTPVFQNEILSERFNGYAPEVKKTLLELFYMYQAEAQANQEAQFQQQLERAKAVALVEAGIKAGTAKAVEASPESKA